MKENIEQRIGLIAGSGEIPKILALKALKMGIKVISISMTQEIGEVLAPHVQKDYSIWIGRPQKIFDTFRSENVSQFLLAGKFEKKMVFQLQMFDITALKILGRLATRQDKAILEECILFAEEEGFTVLDQKQYLNELFPGKGILTRKKPGKIEMEDIDFGVSIARDMADQEIGQTIVVKNKTVIAVEGVEGTDLTIERGCELANGKCVAIKVSRTNQDYRYDCPGIGPKTVETLVKGNASALALEAERVMIVERERVVKMADEAGLSIICV
ncbi:MAG: UDP-2,3-diacylglucosamine diphosphatase LpxI [Nitrospinae bacterium]|nr:UDP-2,3-diacylglucosamine diphosphatase LpxI [Nitrospinota bacterium]